MNTQAPVNELGLTNTDAEIAVLHAMRIDTNLAIDLSQTLIPDDFYDTRRQVVFQAISTLLMGVEPIDTPSIFAECASILRERNLKLTIDKPYIESLEAGDIRRATMYANTVRKLAWLRRTGDFAFWLVQELQERPQPDELFAAAQEKWQLLAPKKAESRFVYGWDTVHEHRDIIRQRVQGQQTGNSVRFDWPWSSWNNDRVRPLQPGFVGILAAPDGQGKTTYLEQIAEHWASRGIHTVYVHLEDSRQYKYDRRLARHASISINSIQDGKFTAAEMRQAEEAHARIEQWVGCLHYYDAAGESMANIVRELESRVAEGVCQAVVFDYLDKVQPSRGQSHLYAGNTWERQANDMEQLKTFAEKNSLPVFTATQGNKTMQSSGTQTRQAIQGSGQKSQKAQLVLILTRDLVGDDGLRDKSGRVLAEPGEYSPIATIRIDKQNTGRTGTFMQRIIGQHFTVKDLP